MRQPALLASVVLAADAALDGATCLPVRADHGAAVRVTGPAAVELRQRERSLAERLAVFKEQALNGTALPVV